ncbi:dihydrofolate reductase [Atopobacter phocae]|uniref:dihydrofolate reductase n=1 Tax=Atopobacter phocae TaxID=136492 RepID=UPI0004719852|nr:dihydrofolate reductase [Atopobacter phocae]
MLRFVFAEDMNHIIGNQQQLPWRIPEELAYFKTQTMNHQIVMGRKTFDGMNHRLLPGRETRILSRQPLETYHGAPVVSVEDVLNQSTDQIIDIIGGSEVFEVFLPYVDVLVRSVIQETFEGDTWMPTIDYTTFECVSQQEVTTKNQQSIRYEIWVKKGSI